MTPEGQGGQAVEPTPARRGGRARGASSRAADWTWGIFRRVHLGTRKPENWMQLFKFGVAVSNNFLLNRHWTFQATEGHAGFQAARFFTVSLLALGVNLVFLYLL